MPPSLEPSPPVSAAEPRTPAWLAAIEARGLRLESDGAGGGPANGGSTGDGGSPATGGNPATGGDPQGGAGTDALDGTLTPPDDGGGGGGGGPGDPGPGPGPGPGGG